jgi:hypothetical protein
LFFGCGLDEKRAQHRRFGTSRPRSARQRRKINERQSAQFRHLGHPYPIAVGDVDTLEIGNPRVTYRGWKAF